MRDVGMVLQHEGAATAPESGHGMSTPQDQEPRGPDKGTEDNIELREQGRITGLNTLVAIAEELVSHAAAVRMARDLIHKARAFHRNTFVKPITPEWRL